MDRVNVETSNFIMKTWKGVKSMGFYIYEFLRTPAKPSIFKSCEGGDSKIIWYTKKPPRIIYTHCGGNISISNFEDASELFPDFFYIIQ